MEAEFLIVLKEIADMLITRGMKLAVAESCTGGFISNEVTNLPGSSVFFEMSVVSYSAKAKRSVLGVGASVLRKHGTVSEETSLAMAEGIRRLARTDVGLSVTGVAGPERVEDKDVGIVFVAAAVRNAVESKGLKLTGDRETIKKKAALEALRFLKQVMKIWL